MDKAIFFFNKMLSVRINQSRLFSLSLHETTEAAILVV